MKLSEYIKQLEGLLGTHGDLEVETLSIDLRRVTAPLPTLAYVKVLKGRESKPIFWHPIMDEQDRKGPAVIKV